MGLRASPFALRATAATSRYAGQARFLLRNSIGRLDGGATLRLDFEREAHLALGQRLLLRGFARELGEDHVERQHLAGAERFER